MRTALALDTEVNKATSQEGGPTRGRDNLTGCGALLVDMRGAERVGGDASWPKEREVSPELSRSNQEWLGSFRYKVPAESLF
jgi:hypothetical protein